MNMAGAKVAVQPLINKKNAVEYMAQTDKMLWVESTIMHPAGIKSSITSAYGEAICNWIEDQLEALAGSK